MALVKSHPHLYFTENELPELRAKAKHVFFAKDYDAIIARAKDNLIPPLDIEVGRYAELNLFLIRAETCAFAWQLTGDKKYLDVAKETLVKVISLPKYHSNPGDHDFSLELSAFISHGARIFDWVASELNSNEIQLFVEVMYRQAVQVFLDSCLTGNKYLHGNRTMNHLSVYCGGMAELLVVMDGHDIDLSKEIEIVRAHLLRYFEWYDDAGSCLETNDYWAYGMGNAIKGLIAFKKNGWPQIFHQKAKKLNRSCYPQIYSCIGDKMAANFNDCRYGVCSRVMTRHFTNDKKHQREYVIPEGCDERFAHHPMRTIALIFAAEFDDGITQWWANQFDFSDSAGIIFGNPNLKATPPENMPTTAVFNNAGFAVLRDSLTSTKSKMLGLKAGRARGKDFDDPHCQFDLNSILIEANGTSLIIDPGYMHDWSSGIALDDPTHISNSTGAHNTILIGGKGQLLNDNPIAHLQDLSPSDDIDYVVSRIERGYGTLLKKFDRHAYMLDKNFYVIIDEIELNKPELISWNFHGMIDADFQSIDTYSITHQNTKLTISPFGNLELSCQKKNDHFSPRLQFETQAKETSVLTGWLFTIEEDSMIKNEFQAVIANKEAIIKNVTTGKQWSLPIVSRKGNAPSDTMLAFPERVEN